MANIFRAKSLISRTGVFSNEVIAPNLVYNTGDQNVSGIKSFYSRPTVNGTGVLLSGEAASLPITIVYTTGDQTISGIKTFDVAPVISGNTFITGNLSLYATSVNLASTGSTLNTKINTLSGVSVLTYGNQNITGNKTFINNLEVQGTGIFNALDLSNISDFSFSGVTINLIDSIVQSSGQIYISGNPVSTGTVILPNTIVYTTGDQIISGIKDFYHQLRTFGDVDLNYAPFTDKRIRIWTTGFSAGFPIPAIGTLIDISGIYIQNGMVLKINDVEVTPSLYATINNLASTGLNLSNSIDSLSGLFTGYTGNLDSIFASDTQLTNTGITLVNSISSLSGTLTSDYSTIINLASTGSNLQTQINNLDNVYATDTSVTNVSNNLASTGSILDTKINSLSGSSVLLHGDQSIGGIKTFSSPIYFRSGESIYFTAGSGGYIDLRGGDSNSETYVGGVGGYIDLRGGESEEVNANNGGDGGTIQMIGVPGARAGNISLNAGYRGGIGAGRGGDINLAGGFAGGQGGDITMVGADGANAGSINTSAKIIHAGGSINTSADDSAGGSINTAGGSENFPGGSINTSNGGGNIDTRGQGQVQFGVDTTRTILSGTASENRTIYLPDDNGTLVLSKDVVFNTGNQIISGIKTFAENTTFGDTGEADFLVISGNNFTVYGSGNFTSGLFVNSSPVLTGSSTLYATTANLASTGSILQTNINNLSGYINSSSSNIVFTTGNQNIGGNKTFTGVITFSGQEVNLVDTALNLSGLGDMTFSGTNINFINSPVFISGTNLRVSGDVLANNLNNLVYSTGDQNISGNKTFINNINVSGTGTFFDTSIFVDEMTVSGMNLTVANGTGIFSFLNISGNYDIYSQIENSKKLAIAYAIAL